MTKILWHSNGPHTPTGYGVQTALFLPLLAEHHDVTCSAFYGLEGAPINWKGIEVLPSLGGDWGNDTLPEHAKRVFGGDPRGGLVVTLCDVWPFSVEMARGLNMACWTPVDHMPAPEKVTDFLAQSGAVPIAMSRFGEQQLGLLDPLYVPHGCFDYDAPVLVAPGETRKIGDIATGRVRVDSVMGLDGAGQSCRSAVLGQQVLKLRDSYALHVRTEGGHEMVITRDNEVMTSAGWVAAGSLSTSDSLCIMDAERVNDATWNHLDSGRARVAATPLRDGIEGRHTGAFPAPDVIRSASLCESATRTHAGGGGGVCAPTSVEEAAEPDGMRLHRGDPRRRGSHHGDQEPAQDWHALDSARRCEQSVRGADPMAGRSNRLDDPIAQGRSDRLELGVSSCTRGALCGGPAPTATALSRYQTRTSGGRYRVLSCASIGPNESEGDARTDRDCRTSARLESPPIGTYERVVSIEPVQVETVYDLTTETGNFFVDGILVHNCDTEVYRPHDRREIRKDRFPDGAFVVGMVAANKGHPSRKAFSQALEAFARFASAHDDVFLYLHTVLDPNIGQGVNIPALLRALGIPLDRVRIADQYSLLYRPHPPRDMAQIYSAFDVLLNPSFGEGFGVCVLEAQSCGIPAIVTNWTAMPEVCGAGWHVDHHPYWSGLNAWQAIPKIDDIVAALEECHALSPARREKLSQMARKHSLDFDAKRVVKEYWLPVLRAAEQRFSASSKPVTIPSRLKAVAA